MSRPPISESNDDMASKQVFILLFLVALANIYISGAPTLNMNLSGGRYIIQATASMATLIAWILGLLIVLGLHKRPGAEMDIARPVGLFKRFVACFIDSLLYSIVLGTTIPLLALAIEGIRTSNFAWWFSRGHRVGSDVIVEISFHLVFILTIVLFALPVARQRQSLGQLITGYAVITESGRITLLRACLRCVLAYFSCILFVLSCPMALLRKDRRMWHDLVFKTYPCKETTEV
ncbi:MAG: RDD family protein [bacterium]|nr:RDD family protein [bacterium]